MYKELFDNNHCVMLLIDPSTGDIKDANMAACKYYGWSHSELCSKNITEINTLSKEQVKSEMERGNRKNCNTFFFEHRLANGRIRHVEVWAGQVNVGGKTLFHWIVHDITARKEAEAGLAKQISDFESIIDERTKQLSETNEILSKLNDILLKKIIVLQDAKKQLSVAQDEWEKTFDAIVNPIFIIDRDYKILKINQAALDKLNISRKDALGRTCTACVHCTETPPDDCPHLMCIKNRQGYSVEREIKLFNNGHYIVSTTPIFDSDGNHQASICLYSDITKIKQAENKLLKINSQLEDAIGQANEMADRAEAASITKSQFLANMSHEIRTPMNAILGFAQVLERDTSLKPTQAIHIRTILRSGYHLLNLINDILDMSKIEAGRVNLNISNFSLYGLIDDLEVAFHSRADSKGLELKVERDANLPDYVTSDDGKLRQILVNLLGNAIKFTETGRIILRIRSEQNTREDPKQHRLVVEVEDSGPGISDGEIRNLFIPFQQAEAGIKAGGTGLGLAISSRLVEMMGGNIKVASQIGQGSCFRFEVLLNLADQDSTVKPLPLKCVVGIVENQKIFRILVVDDKLENRSFLSELLVPVGFDIKEAENGLEAVQTFESWLPDAVLMDIRMPVMDGYDAIRRIRTTQAGRHTVIIAITAGVFEEDRRKVMEAGADVYLPKPFEVGELFNALLKIDGVNYIFADNRDSDANQLQISHISPDSIHRVLASLPDSTIELIRQALDGGDMVSLKDMIGEVEKVDFNVATELRFLAEDYDYDKLNDYLEKAQHTLQNLNR